MTAEGKLLGPPRRRPGRRNQRIEISIDPRALTVVTPAATAVDPTGPFAGRGTRRQLTRRAQALQALEPVGAGATIVTSYPRHQHEERIMAASRLRQQVEP